ncbi:ROK family protein (plasmid) [Pedobacter sp. BS3]|uniref:ROK family protein n=1 Tax=Pedobacter sp. BS3 TaxID=2567937 RepID=UPI0011EE1BFF|nr:ROK family protein [Pedobacter sp. BS3]TZF86105.1 ROK family protein [Pedobacter sp. BS3]
MKDSYAIGIDVGGTAIKYGLADKKGTMVYSSLLPLGKITSEKEVIALIISAAQECIQKVGHKSGIKGIGIGFPGIVENGVVIGGADNLPGFTNIALSQMIQQTTGLNTLIDNDANMMAWGEVMYGAAQNCTDVVFLTVGTGIGGSLVINGSLYGGYKNRGTELGHIIIEHDGLPCSCGGRGCLEAYASVNALITDYAERIAAEVNAINGKLITERYLAGDVTATAAMNRHFDYMASGVASLVNIFSPQKVVVGGGITEAGNFYIEEIGKRVLQKAMKDAVANTQLVAATLGNKAGILGCTGNVFSRHLSGLTAYIY